MAITNELRDYARHLHNVWYDPRGNVYTYTTMDIAPSLDAVRLDEHVLAIADRIDAECERQLEALYHDMSDAEYIELPKDADGEPIRIGDAMEWPTTGETFEVVGIGDGVLFYVDDGNEKADWTGASTKRHHTPDSWERIIKDAIRGDGGSYGCLEERFDAMVPALVARCEALAQGEAK